jgi:large subunit ribosomal protein L19
MSQQIIATVEKKYQKANLPDFRVGDTVDVHLKIIEGSKSRIQVFNGVVIARSGGGVNASFKVRRIVYNEGVERTFLVHSPLITKIEVKRRGKARRAKLFFLRDRVGKARRLRELRSARAKKRAGKLPAPADPAVDAANTPDASAAEAVSV